MLHESPQNTPDVVAALEAARNLAATGVPIFLARAATENDTERQRKTGFVLPAAWEKTIPDPAVVDRWQPGMALCAVMGHGLDLLDLDPRNGGTLPDGFPVPTSYGIASTPNGGLHSYIRALGVGSRDGVFPGVDVKGGRADGTGHGFAFLPPTIKRLKDGENWGPYTWVRPPDFAAYLAAGNDASGQALGARVTELLATKAAPKAPVAGDWMAEFASAQRAPQSSVTADRAIRRELALVSGWTAEAGGFRQVLLRAAFVLGGYVGAGHLVDAVADEYLGEAVRECWGEVDDDDATWIQQGLTDGRSRPFLVYSAADQVAGPAAMTQESGQAPVRKWTFYDAIGVHAFDPRTDGSDQALAEAVLERTYPGLRASMDTGGWVVRGEQVWEEREDLADWATAQVARLMPLGESPVPKDHSERTDLHWQSVRRSLFMGSAGAGKVSAKIRSVVKGNHPVGVHLAELDNDPGVLWAGGVPWDLELSGAEPVPAPVDPATPHLHTARFLPDAAVETPLWDAFLAAVFPDPAVRSWAIRVLSVAVTGHSPRVLPLLYGEKGLGKSQVVELMTNLLGTYGSPGDTKLITDPRAHGHHIYELKGKRLVYIDEPPSTSHDNLERLKMLTGGGQLIGDPKNKKSIRFNPSHTLVMMTNDPPVLNDDALRDRVKVIDCQGDPREVSERRRAFGWVTTQVQSPAWKREAPGVLAMLMREAAAWMADQDSTDNDRAPMGSQQAVAEMVAASDPIYRWMLENTVPAEPGTLSSDLHKAFAVWFSEHPEYRRRMVPGSIAFGIRLTKLGVGLTHMNDGKHRHLAFKSLGGWANPQPVDKLSTEATLTYEQMTGTPVTDDGLKAEPVTAENPSSDPGLTENMTGVTGSLPLNSTEEKVGIYSSGASNTGEPVTRHSGAEISAKAQVKPGTDGLTGNPSRPEIATESDKPGTELVKTGADQHKQLSRTAAAKVRAQAKAAEKAQAKADRISAAAGPHLGLPAAMRRGEEPRAITLDEAWAIVTECLYRTGGRLAVDVESSGRPIGHPDYVARTVQLGDDMEGIDLDLDDPDSRELARRACHEALELNAHNATADLAPLAYIDVVSYRAAMSKMVDTAILMKLSDPKDVGNEAGLKDLAPAILGPHALSPAADAAKAELFKAMGCLTEVKPETPLAKNGWAQVDSGCQTMIRYAISDVLDCSAVRRVIPMPDAGVLGREQRVQVITSPSALVGVQLDSGRISAQIAERTPVVNELGRKLAAVGLENANSPMQVNATFAKVGVVLPDTTKETLQKVTALHGNPAVRGLAKTVLDYRKGAKVMSSFLKPWLEQCEHGDGIVRPTIYTLGADTGRMSCVRPNAQQLPKKGGMRECWIAGAGMKIISGDFSSVEVRVIAALSQDTVLMKMLADGLKLHDQIALQVFGPGYTETQRTWAKSGVFAHFFGAGVEKIAVTIQSTLEVAQAVVDAIAVVAPGVHEWTQRVQAQVRAGMSTFTTYSGRVIHLDTKRPYAAVNYQVQGTAREVLADSLIKWDDGPYAGGLVLPVHDELLAWVPSDVAEEASRYLEQCLTTELYGVKIMCEMDPPSDRWVSAKS